VATHEPFPGGDETQKRKDGISRNRRRLVGDIAIALSGTLVVGIVTVMGILTMALVHDVFSQVMLFVVTITASFYVVLSGVRLIEPGDRGSEN